MSEILKSAFGYFNADGTQGAENDFVGQTVEIGNVKLKVKRIIAEGRSFLQSRFITIDCFRRICLCLCGTGS